ncbi:MAG TPA: transcriptional regulator, partial [Rhodobacteraceae bacterium]|nr:transcriptional regulator [Paracoccaceae bacterium]
MPKSRKPRNTGCPFAYSLDVFGDRWSLIIIRDMLFQGFQTYGEFQSSQEGIATNILADRLAHLEANGLISKTRDPKNGR